MTFLLLTLTSLRNILRERGNSNSSMEKTFLKIKKKKEKKKKRQESLHNNKRLKKGLKLKLKAVKKLTVFAQHCLVWVI